MSLRARVFPVPCLWSRQRGPGSNNVFLRYNVAGGVRRIVDRHEQIVLQSALNAMPHCVSISAYRFRHVADRLAKRGLLEMTEAKPEKASYAITSAGQGKLNALRTQRTPPLPVAAE